MIAKSDSGASNNYWRTEDTTVLTNVKKTRDGPTVKFTKNETMSATRIVNTPLASSISAHAKRRTYLMDCTVTHLSLLSNCLIMTVSPL